jgi:hypothetical protein
VMPFDYSEVPRFVLAHHVTWSWVSSGFAR